MLNAAEYDVEDMSLPDLRSVLIIEDDGLVQMLLEDLVRELGARHVEVCRNPVDALRVASHVPLDCAILDISLWGGTSYEIADVLAARGIPFLFCTGLDFRDVAPRYRRRPILGKPFTEEQFRLAMTETLTR